MAHKPRVAFLGAGLGIPAAQGGGEGLPMLTALLSRLAVDYEVVIYSLIRVDMSRLPAGVKLKQISSGNISSYLKYFLLTAALVADHIRNPYGILNAISAFPAGRIAVILGAIFRRPVVVHLIGSETVMMPEISYGDLLIPRLGKIAAYVCRKADVLIVQSHYQKLMTEENLKLRREATVMSRSVEVGKFPYRERSVSFPLQFLHVASFHPVKDQETLFRTFARIAKEVECNLTVAGGGFDTPIVKQWLAELGIAGKVRFVGMVRHSEVTHFLDRAHILLHTSRYESLCGAVLEAMSSGVPVCATTVGIMADLGDPLVVTVPTHDPDALASATLSLIRDAERYSHQQKLAREYIVGHDADWAAGNYRRLFDQLIRNQIRTARTQRREGAAMG